MGTIADFSLISILCIAFPDSISYLQALELYDRASLFGYFFGLASVTTHECQCKDNFL